MLLFSRRENKGEVTRFPPYFFFWMKALICNLASNSKRSLYVSINKTIGRRYFRPKGGDTAQLVKNLFFYQFTQEKKSGRRPLILDRPS